MEREGKFWTVPEVGWGVGVINKKVRQANHQPVLKIFEELSEQCVALERWPPAWQCRPKEGGVGEVFSQRMREFGGPQPTVGFSIKSGQG